jgi:hypothetical protein
VVSFEPCCDRRRRGQDRWPSSGARCLPRSIPSIQTTRASESEPNHRTWIITRSSSPGREEVSSTRLPRSPPHSLGGPWSLASCFAPACVRVTMRPCLRAAAPCGELTSLGAAPRSPAQPAAAPRPLSTASDRWHGLRAAGFSGCLSKLQQTTHHLGSRHPHNLL